MAAPSAEDLSREYLLDPRIAFLNHGSFGACPRPVFERTRTVPGTSFMAFSIGLVIVAIISSAGISPLSIMIVTRGKLVCGKTLEGIDDAE